MPWSVRVGPSHEMPPSSGLAGAAKAGVIRMVARAAAATTTTFLGMGDSLRWWTRDVETHGSASGATAPAPSAPGQRDGSKGTRRGCSQPSIEYDILTAQYKLRDGRSRAFCGSPGPATG